MTEDNARAELPIWSNENSYNNSERRRSESRYERADRLRAELRNEMEDRVDYLKKRYGIAVIVFLVWVASLLITFLITSYSVHNKTVKEEEEHYAPYLAELTKYKQKEWDEGQANFLSDENSKAAAMQDDAVQLAHDSGMWKNENAFKTYCWNVIIRKMSPRYPNSIAEVLDQPKQYDYHDHGDTFNQEKYLWAMEVLEQADTGMLPAYLSLDHIVLEVRNGGNDCVLNTESGNDQWRYQG